MWDFIVNLFKRNTTPAVIEEPEILFTVVCEHYSEGQRIPCDDSCVEEYLEDVKWAGDEEEDVVVVAEYVAAEQAGWLETDWFP